jgi:hypothetical protein
LNGRVEREVWKELNASGGYVVHTKPRLTDVIDDRDANWDPVQTEFMRKAHFDFVVTDNSPSAKPLVAIELDGPSHQVEAQKRRDALKDEICKLAGFPLWRFGPIGLPPDLLPGWVRHVYELWKVDRAMQETKQTGHPPLWEALEQVKNCLTRIKQRRFALEVKSSDLLECPVGPHVEGYAKVTASVGGRTASAEATTLGVPTSDRALKILAIELAEYKVLQELGAWH